MEHMHSLLKRQLRRNLGGSDFLPKEWQGFIDAVNNVYFEFDADRSMLERCLELTSQELLEANSGMRAVFERLIYSSMDGIFAFDRECRYTVWNPALERIFGLSKFQTLGKSAFDMFPFLKESGADKFYRDALAGKTVVAKDKQYIVPGTGERIFVEGHFSPLLDDSGTIIGGLAIFRDITERKRAEDALRHSEAYLGEAQRLSHTGSFGWRVFSGEIFWSEETFRIFEYDPANCKPTVELVLQRIHPEDIALVQQTIDRASHDGTDWDLEHRLLMPDGAVKYVHVVSHAVRDQSGKLEFVGAVLDITERKRTAEALRKAQAELAHVTRVTTLGQMTASIAHEVNQPLTAIVNNASACLRWLAASNQDEARQSAALTIADAHRASEIIGRIRAFVTKAPPQKAWLNINEIILDVIALARSEVQGNGVSLETQLSDDVPLIFGDRIQLQQVILNLINNAVEAMSGVGEGPRELRVGSAKDESQGVLVTVHDSGPGLDPVSLDHFFTAFYTTKRQGMGMGLPISRSIIEAHGGRLWALPNHGPGATFQFSLPKYE
jgi:PAS domain S-box-containing protein